MKIISSYSPNHSKKTRLKRDINFIIIHYTGMQSEIESIKRLTNPKFQVSCHYIINRNGEVIQLVKDKNIAWHAGKSKWKKFINLNNKSIGIELVNKGHKFGYQSFSKKQITSLLKLCKKLKNKYKIKKENFLGHSDIAPLRKIDPGEKFPWKNLASTILASGIYKRHNVVEFSKKKECLFFKNLWKLGYRYFKVNSRSYTDKKIIKSFQQHYLPKNVTGKIDKKTYEISYFLTH